MSTNSMIFKVSDDQTRVRGIYCHWDGYLEYNGAILNEYYQDPAKVDRLIDLGALSSLGANPEQHPIVKKYGFDYINSPEYEAMTDDERNQLSKEIVNYTIAYHRARGEELDIMDMSLDEFSLNFATGNFRYGGPEYLYLMGKENGQWTWSVCTEDYDLERGRSNWHKPQSLATELAKIDA